MNPESKSHRNSCNAKLDEIVKTLENIGDQHLTRSDVRDALFPRFGQWMKENNLPKTLKR